MGRGSVSPPYSLADVVPRQDELVVVVRTEGKYKDEIYIARYPDLDDRDSDVILGRVTDSSWMADLNAIIADLEALEVEYVATNGAGVIRVPEDHHALRHLAGHEFYGDTLQEAFFLLVNAMQEPNMQMFGNIHVYLSEEDVQHLLQQWFNTGGAG